MDFLRALDVRIARELYNLNIVHEAYPCSHDPETGHVDPHPNPDETEWGGPGDEYWAGYHPVYARYDDEYIFVHDLYEGETEPRVSWMVDAVPFYTLDVRLTQELIEDVSVKYGVTFRTTYGFIGDSWRVNFDTEEVSFPGSFSCYGNYLPALVAFAAVAVMDDVWQADYYTDLQLLVEPETHRLIREPKKVKR